MVSFTPATKPSRKPTQTLFKPVRPSETTPPPRPRPRPRAQTPHPSAKSKRPSTAGERALLTQPEPNFSNNGLSTHELDHELKNAEHGTEMGRTMQDRASGRGSDGNEDEDEGQDEADVQEESENGDGDGNKDENEQTTSGPETPTQAPAQDSRNTAWRSRSAPSQNPIQDSASDASPPPAKFRDRPFAKFARAKSTPKAMPADSSPAQQHSPAHSSKAPAKHTLDLDSNRPSAPPTEAQSSGLKRKRGGTTRASSSEGAKHSTSKTTKAVMARSNAQEKFFVRAVLDQIGKRYVVDWEPSEDGMSYPPTLEPESNLSSAALQEWKEVQREKKRTQRKERGRKKRKVGESRKKKEDERDQEDDSDADERDDEYEAEAILAHVTLMGRRFFQVLWQDGDGWEPKSITWEPARHLNQQLVREYLAG